jgi:hypothetical protein
MSSSQGLRILGPMRALASTSVSIFVSLPLCLKLENFMYGSWLGLTIPAWGWDVTIKKIIEDCPRRWHEVLLEALWAHRTSKHSTTKVTPVELVDRQGAVLSVEINLQVHRVIKPDTLSAEDYTELMMEKIDEMPEGRFRALNEIEGGKVRVVNAYKKKVVE